MKRYCLALDLKEDPSLIAAYEDWHRNLWPEVRQSILQSGIQYMGIFRTGNRLTMYIEAGESFDFAAKSAADQKNPKVQEWETLMWNYQQPLPWAKAGVKWIQMDEIFRLENGAG